MSKLGSLPDHLTKGPRINYDQHQHVVVAPPPGWKVDGKRLIHASLRMAVHTLIGQEDDGHRWFTIQFFPLDNVLPSADRFYEAALSFRINESKPCKVRLISSKVYPLGLEVKVPLDGEPLVEQPSGFTRDVVARAISAAASVIN